MNNGTLNNTLFSEEIETESEDKKNDKESSVFEKVIKYILMVSGGAIILAIIALIIVLIIYCVLKYKKKKEEMKRIPENSISIERGIETTDIMKKNKMDFNKVANTSLSEVGNNQKGNSLSEIRIEKENIMKQSVKTEENTKPKVDENLTPIEKSKKKKKVKKEKNSEISGESSEKEKKVKKEEEKKIENDIQNQLGKFGFDLGDDDE